MKKASLIFTVLLLIMMAPAAWGFSRAAVSASPGANQMTMSDMAVQFDFQRLARRSVAAVVAIHTEVELANRGLGQGDLRETGGDRIGSGFIIDSAGYVLSSAHVVMGGQRLVVTLADGRVCPATVTGADFLVDVAVLKIGCRGDLPTIPIVKTSGPELGEPVMAIGNPYGLAGTVSVGIVSATQRYVPGRLPGFIQTDAVLNPGSSGGPLINSRGQVIGISTAMYTLGGANTGIGFALPIEAVRREIPLLETEGRVAHGWIGAELHPIAPDLALAIAGALVTAVTKGSPAAIAGLRQGDVLVAVDGQPVDAAQQLALYVKSSSVGKHARLTVRRHGSVMEMRVEIHQDNDGARWLADLNDFPI
jgi:serine protease Do